MLEPKLNPCPFCGEIPTHKEEAQSLSDRELLERIYVEIVSARKIKEEEQYKALEEKRQEIQRTSFPDSINCCVGPFLKKTQ